MCSTYRQKCLQTCCIKYPKISMPRMYTPKYETQGSSSQTHVELMQITAALDMEMDIKRRDTDKLL